MPDVSLSLIMKSDPDPRRRIAAGKLLADYFATDKGAAPKLSSLARDTGLHIRIREYAIDVLLEKKIYLRYYHTLLTDLSKDSGLPRSRTVRVKRNLDNLIAELIDQSKHYQVLEEVIHDPTTSHKNKQSALRRFADLLVTDSESVFRPDLRSLMSLVVPDPETKNYVDNKLEVFTRQQATVRLQTSIKEGDWLSAYESSLVADPSNALANSISALKNPPTKSSSVSALALAAISPEDKRVLARVITQTYPDAAVTLVRTLNSDYVATRLSVALIDALTIAVVDVLIETGNFQILDGVRRETLSPQVQTRISENYERALINGCVRSDDQTRRTILGICCDRDKYGYDLRRKIFLGLVSAHVVQGGYTALEDLAFNRSIPRLLRDFAAQKIGKALFNIPNLTPELVVFLSRSPSLGIDASEFIRANFNQLVDRALDVQFDLAKSEVASMKSKGSEPPNVCYPLNEIEKVIGDGRLDISSRKKAWQYTIALSTDFGIDISSLLARPPSPDLTDKAESLRLEAIDQAAASGRRILYEGETGKGTLDVRPGFYPMGILSPSFSVPQTAIARAADADVQLCLNKGDVPYLLHMAHSDNATVSKAGKDALIPMLSVCVTKADASGVESILDSTRKLNVDSLEELARAALREIESKKVNRQEVKNPLAGDGLALEARLKKLTAPTTKKRRTPSAQPSA
ncbi:hypothetical protein HY990_05420 [Candidatus Micrarchaeota archaeon]|nr:hypothetical protein [Candidatus Micrarchaeota archaeon]